MVPSANAVEPDFDQRRWRAVRIQPDGDGSVLVWPPDVDVRHEHVLDVGDDDLVVERHPGYPQDPVPPMFLVEGLPDMIQTR